MTHLVTTLNKLLSEIMIYELSMKIRYNDLKILTYYNGLSFIAFKSKMSFVKPTYSRMWFDLILQSHVSIIS